MKTFKKRYVHNTSNTYIVNITLLGVLLLITGLGITSLIENIALLYWFGVSAALIGNLIIAYSVVRIFPKIVYK